MLAHSWKDGLLIAVAGVHVALLGAAVAAAPGLGPGALAALVALLAFLTCTNYQCVAHNHIHNPFFRSRGLNRAFAALNSVGLGMPSTLYRFHHLDHHRFNNDRPAGGPVRDRSSTYRYGRDGAEEGLLRYAVLSVFRTELGVLVAEARRKRLGGQVALEVGLLVAALVGAGLLGGWRGLLGVYLPAWFLGQVAAFAENWLEHHGARPGDRRTDSVSSYGWLYNLVWFNNGYHQEHHYRPQVHWTALPSVRAELPPEGERRVVAGAHWLNVDWVQGRSGAYEAVTTRPAPTSA